ncbi:MAG TPA: hypothetical protein PLD47_07790 [Aggregatilineales bacterium]|nr:hypothetical protein [Aggregatilineales bacterium]
MIARKTLMRAFTFLLVAGMIAACGGATSDPPAANMMPALSGYNVTDTMDIVDTVSKAIAGAAASGGQLQVTGAVLFANELAKCYQKAGAVQGRTYLNQANPLDSGLVIIVNRNKLIDPATLLGCIAPNNLAGAATIGDEYQPCAFVYTLPKDNNEFYIGFIATNEPLCSQFCSKLEGCSERRGK